MARRYHNDFTLATKLPPHIFSLRTGNAWAVTEGRLKEFIGGEPRLVVGSGILTEPAATNLIPYGRQIEAGTGWTIVNGVPSSNFGLDGLAGSGTEIEPTDPCTISRSITGAYDKYVFSLYVKVHPTNTEPVYISINSKRRECEGVTTEWQRFSISSRTANPTVKIECSGTISIDCLQLETGLIPSSPIPTSGSPVTRNEDKIGMVWPASGVTPFNPEAGTFILNVVLNQLSTSNQVLFKMYDNSALAYQNLRVAITRDDVTRYNIGYNIPFEYTTSTAADESFQYDLNIRIATSYITGQQNIAINGLIPLESTQTEAIDFSGITHLSLGSDEYSDQMAGYITEVTYYDEFFDTPQLVQLSNGRVGQLSVVDEFTGNEQADFDEAISSLYRYKNKISMYNFVQSLDNSEDQNEDEMELTQVYNNLNMTNNLN